MYANAHVTFLPGSMARSSPRPIFFAIMLAPATPNPTCNKPPILVRVFSKITVSNSSTWDTSACAKDCKGLSASFLTRLYILSNGSTTINSASHINTTDEPTNKAMINDVFHAFLIALSTDSAFLSMYTVLRQPEVATPLFKTPPFP